MGTPFFMQFVCAPKELRPSLWNVIPDVRFLADSGCCSITHCMVTLKIQTGSVCFFFEVDKYMFWLGRLQCHQPLRKRMEGSGHVGVQRGTCMQLVSREQMVLGKDLANYVPQHAQSRAGTTYLSMPTVPPSLRVGWCRLLHSSLSSSSGSKRKRAEP